jgi:hypothetical protein
VGGFYLCAIVENSRKANNLFLQEERREAEGGSKNLEIKNKNFHADFMLKKFYWHEVFM